MSIAPAHVRPCTPCVMGAGRPTVGASAPWRTRRSAAGVDWSSAVPAPLPGSSWPRPRICGCAPPAYAASACPPPASSADGSCSPLAPSQPQTPTTARKPPLQPVNTLHQTGRVSLCIGMPMSSVYVLYVRNGLWVAQAVQAGAAPFVIAAAAVALLVVLRFGVHCVSKLHKCNT